MSTFKYTSCLLLNTHHKNSIINIISSIDKAYPYIHLGEKVGEKQESILAEAANAEGGTKEEKGKVEEEGDVEGESFSSGTLSLIKILQTSDIPTS